jgi:hypothetical protein
VAGRALPRKASRPRFVPRRSSRRNA